MSLLGRLETDMGSVGVGTAHNAIGEGATSAESV